MGGEGRAFSSHGLQVKRGHGCPEAAWHPQVPHQQEEHVPSARAWLSWHRNWACGWGRKSPSGHVSQRLSSLDGPWHPAQAPPVQRCLGATAAERCQPGQGSDLSQHRLGPGAVPGPGLGVLGAPHTP